MCFQRAPMTWADYGRYFLALVIAFGTIALFVVKASQYDWGESIANETMALLPLIAGLAVASAVGHALLSDLRGGVSLMLSSLATGAVLTGMLMFPFMVFLGYGPFNAAVASALPVIPVIVIAHILRVIVHPLRPHVDGKPVRYFRKKTTGGQGLGFSWEQIAKGDVPPRP